MSKKPSKKRIYLKKAYSKHFHRISQIKRFLAHFTRVFTNQTKLTKNLVKEFLTRTERFFLKRPEIGPKKKVLWRTSSTRHFSSEPRPALENPNATSPANLARN